MPTTYNIPSDLTPYRPPSGLLPATNIPVPTPNPVKPPQTFTANGTGTGANKTSTMAVAPQQTGSIWSDIGGAISDFLGTNQRPSTTVAQPTPPQSPLSISNSPARPPSSNVPIANAAGTPPTPSAPARPPVIEPQPAPLYQGNYDLQGNQIGNQSAIQPPTPPTDSSQSNTPDRFAQIKTLEANAQTAGQMNPEEITAQQELNQLNASTELGLAKITGNPEPLELQTGQSNVLRQQSLAKAGLLTNQLALAQARRQASLQGTQAAIGAEQNVLGLQQPVGVGIGQALISPTTGQQIGGNATLSQLSGGQSGGTIGSLAEQVLSGNTSYADAVSSLPSTALAPALLQAVLAKDPKFSITQSNQNAAARASQLQQNVTITQPLKLAMNTALDHLNGLQTIVDKVGYSDIPIINTLRQGISNNLFSDADIRQLQSQIGLVREEVAKVLGGGTATDAARADANAIIPDNISPSQFEKVISEVKNRMQEKIDEYSKVGSAAQYGNSSQAGQQGQTVTAGGYTYVFKNGQWQPQ